MRIVFFGASELGYTCCEYLIKNGHNVVGIFTIEQEFKISYSPNGPVKNYLFKDFRAIGNTYNIPTYIINGNLKDYYDQLISLKPDFFLVIGWYYMIPEKFLLLAQKGTVGIHASLLPKYRGNAPLVWAMIKGEKETGISLFYLAEGVDLGDIIAQEAFLIDEQDTIKDLLEKTTIASLKILKNYIPKIAEGIAPRFKQDHSNSSTYPKRSPEDGLIDWKWDCERIQNFIRAQTKPYPGAFTIINGKKVIIWDASITQETKNEK